VFPVLFALIDRELVSEDEVVSLWELVNKQTLLGKLKATVQGLILELMGKIVAKYSSLITRNEREQFLRFADSVIIVSRSFNNLG
jgi:hypothetical protein